MNKIRPVIVFLVFILSCSLFVLPALASGVPQEVLSASASVVYIEVESLTAISSGSGFIIQNDADGTYIATNNHVIEENPNGVSVWTGEDEKRSALVIASSEEYDLAVIKLSEPIVAQALVLSPNANQGDEVFAIGYPAAANSLSDSEAHLSNEATITNGIISSLRSLKNVDYGPDVQLLQINAEINLGNSGGPLLNEKGQVVGINTYGVLDSQGIFGAISAVELIDFIESNDLFVINTVENNTPSWVIIVGLVLCFVALVVCTILFLPKLRKRAKNKAIRELQLNEYLERIGAPLDTYSIVSLLMPILLQLRDKHNQGSVYLKLSPSSLSVTKDRCKLHESNDAPADDFVAPEQRSGGFAGIKADIYCVCAILSHMINYYYKNISQVENPNKDATEIELRRIIEKGLAENPVERYASLQELILELSPFNTGISEKAQEPFLSALKSPENLQGTDHHNNKASVPKKKRRIIAFASIGVGVIMVAVFGYSAMNYFMAIEHAKNYEFKDADIEMSHVMYSDVMFPDDYAYIGAGANMLNREYDKAIGRLEALGDYVGAADLLNEAKYRKAAMLSNEGSFDSAVKIYEEINGYKDSDILISDTTFRKACYFITTGEAYQDSLAILQSLSKDGYAAATEKIPELYYIWGNDLILNEKYLEAYEKINLAGDFEDASQISAEIKDLLYYIGIDNYHATEYEQARIMFETIGSYLSSDDYIILIDVQLNSYFSNMSDELLNIIGFEDANELIMSSDIFACDFLRGEWKGDSKYFTMTPDDSITYNVPWFNYGDYYKIEDGQLMFYKESTPSITKTLFAITIINNDCIQIFSYKNNRTYTMYRQ